MNYDTGMPRYKNYAPTQFDSRGYILDDRQDWYVLPISQTRDSGIIGKSNFESGLKMLGGERENILEVHRFGHWGPGWFEIIIVNPRAGKTVRTAMRIEDALDNYPILDEIDFSEKEWEEMHSTWENMTIKERIEICNKAGESIFAARHDTPPEDVYSKHLGVQY